jgi:hypothetical protein
MSLVKCAKIYFFNYANFVQVHRLSSHLATRMFNAVPNISVEDINSIKHNFNYYVWLLSTVMIIMITVCIFGVSNVITFKPNLIRIRRNFLYLKHADVLKDKWTDNPNFLYFILLCAYRAKKAKIIINFLLKQRNYIRFHALFSPFNIQAHLFPALPSESDFFPNFR